MFFKSNNHIPFSKPSINYKEMIAVLSVMKSGWLTTGKKCQEFERAIKQHLQDDNLEVVAVNSATAALHLALEALGIKAGDEVIVPTHTFTATAEVVRYMGADPVFVDIDLNTYTIDPEQIRAKVTKRTKAIIPVHMAGLTCDMYPIFSIARKYNLYVIEDAAHVFPATYKSKKIGTLESDATVFSFYSNKAITTGEGGALVTRHSKMADRARIMRLHGIDRDVFNRYHTPKASWRYQVIAPGFKYNLTDIAAAIGIEQIKKSYLLQRKRQIIAHTYIQKLKDLPLFLPPQERSGDIHSWHIFMIRIDPSKMTIDRDDFIERLAQQGISCSVHYIPLHHHPYWKNTYNLNQDDYPNSNQLYETCISLPLFPDMTLKQIQKVCASVRYICLENLK